MRYLALAGLIAVGAGAYALFGRLLGAFSFGEILGALRRKGAA